MIINTEQKPNKQTKNRIRPQWEIQAWSYEMSKSWG